MTWSSRGLNKALVAVALAGAATLALLAASTPSLPDSSGVIYWQCAGVGTACPVNSTYPLPVTGSISATNPSVGLNGAAIPLSSTQFGWKDGSGNLQAVSAANPLPISGSLSISGTTSNASSGVATSSTNSPGVSYLYGFNGTTWDQLQVDGSKNLKTVFSNTSITANAGTNLNTSLLALESGGNLATIVTNTGGIATTNTNLGAPGATACATDTGSCSANSLFQRIAQRLSSILTALGSPFQAGGSIGNTSFGATQATASQLNATVVGAGSAQALNAGVLTVSTPTSNKVSGTANTTGTGTTSLVSAVASNRLYITAYSCSNNGTSNTLVSFQDGSGGTTLWTVQVPAGGGNNLGSATPMFWTTSGNALFFASGTASTTVYCSASGSSGG